MRGSWKHRAPWSLDKTCSPCMQPASTSTSAGSLLCVGAWCLLLIYPCAPIPMGPRTMPLGGLYIAILYCRPSWLHDLLKTKWRIPEIGAKFVFVYSHGSNEEAAPHPPTLLPNLQLSDSSLALNCLGCDLPLIGVCIDGLKCFFRDSLLSLRTWSGRTIYGDCHFDCLLLICTFAWTWSAAKELYIISLLFPIGVRNLIDLPNLSHLLSCGRHCTI